MKYRLIQTLLLLTMVGTIIKTNQIKLETVDTDLETITGCSNIEITKSISRYTNADTSFNNKTDEESAFNIVSIDDNLPSVPLGSNIEISKINNQIIEEEITTSWDEIDSYVYEICDRYENLSPAFVYGIIKKESGFDSTALSSANCIGLMQLNPDYQTERQEELEAYNLYNPYDNIEVGCDFFNTLLSEYDTETAMKVYYCGASNVDKKKYQKGQRNYINKVYTYMDEWEENYSDDYEVYLNN